MLKAKPLTASLPYGLENTDYEKAAGDSNLAALASKGITLSNYFAVTHPSEPVNVLFVLAELMADSVSQNYCASHGGDNFGMDNDDFNQIVANVSAVTALLEEKCSTHTDAYLPRIREYH